MGSEAVTRPDELTAHEVPGITQPLAVCRHGTVMAPPDSLARVAEPARTRPGVDRGLSSARQQT